MATQTARTLIQKALQHLGVLAAGQTTDTTPEADFLIFLNNMLEAWSLQNLMVYADVEEAQTLTSGTARYTVGTNGNFNTNRPLTIRDDIFIRDTSNIDYPVRLVSLDVYRDQSDKTTQNRPDMLAYQPEYPLGVIYLYPTPNNSTDVLRYRARALLTSFATITTSVDFAPGYEEAIIYNLAVRLAPYNRVTISPDVVALAGLSANTIKQHNMSQRVHPVKLRELSILTSRRNRYINIERGPYG